MRKRRLKSWVVNVICVVDFISILVIASETNSIASFMISKLVALLVLFGSYKLLERNC